MGKLKEKILLLYHPTNDTLHRWFVEGEEKAGSLSDASSDSEEVVLLLSGLDVVLTSVELPATNKTKQLKALPYALEESLLESPEAYHFCVEPGAKKNEFAVAYIAKKRFADILSACQQARLTVSAVFPSVLSVPITSPAWGLYVYDDTVLIRTSNDYGVTSSLESASFLIDSMCETQDPAIDVYNYSQKAFELNHPELRYHDCHGDDLMATFTVESPRFNLMQGEFSVKSKNSRSILFWSVSVTTLVACVVLQLGSLLNQATELSSVNQRLEDKIGVIYKQHFPEARSVVAPTYRLNQKLSALEVNESQSGFYVLLAAVGQIFSHQENIHIQRLHFESDHLVVGIVASDFNEVIELKKRLNESDLKVEQSNVVKAGSNVTTTLTITRRDS